APSTNGTGASPDGSPSTPPPPSSPLSPSGGSGGDPHSDDDRKAMGTEVRFQPDPMAGALNYAYASSLPPGRAKLTPNISLQYSSAPGSNVNVFGYGWSISIPSIMRINRKGTDSMYTQNYFFSSIDGELASTSDTGYGPLSDNGNFNKYVYSTSTNAWTL